jgi:hypothetical protein
LLNFIGLLFFLNGQLIWKTFELPQDGFYQMEGLIQLHSILGSCEDYLSTVEDQHDKFWLGQPIDQPRKQLRLIPAELVMLIRQSQQTYWKLYVARGHNILDLEVR